MPKFVDSTVISHLQTTIFHTKEQQQASNGGLVVTQMDTCLQTALNVEILVREHKTSVILSIPVTLQLHSIISRERFIGTIHNKIVVIKA